MSTTSKEFLTLTASIVKTWKKVNNKDKLPLYDRIKELNNRFNADPSLAEKEYTFLFSTIADDVIKDPSLKWLKRSSVKIAVGGASMAPLIKTSVDLSDVWNKLHSLDDVISEFEETAAKFKRLFLTLAVEHNKSIAKDAKIKELLSTSQPEAKAEKPTETKDAKTPVDMGAMFNSLMPMIVAGLKNLPDFIEQYAEESKDDDGVMGQLMKIVKEAKIDEALKKISASLEGKESLDPTALLEEAKESFDMDAITATAKKNLEATSSNVASALAAARKKDKETTIEVPQLEAPDEE
jgi:hypothetical protein